MIDLVKHAELHIIAGLQPPFTQRSQELPAALKHLIGLCLTAERGE
jgi:hypothetical protein